MSYKPLKVGLIGAGHLGKIHLKLLQQSQMYELIGFYDENKEYAQQIETEFGYKFFSEVDELIYQVEVVDIVTPTLFHHFYAMKAIELGKHFFIEKPITQTLEQAKELIQLAKEKNLKAQVGHVERFNPAFSSSVPFIKNPMFIEIHRLAEFNPRGTDVSVVLDLMIHDIDIVLSIVNSPVKNIYANGVSVVSKSPDIANARIEFENGCVANFTTSRISMKNMRKCRFFQKDAYISMDFLEKKAEIIRMQDAPKEPNPFDMIIVNAEGEKNQIIFEYPKIEPNNAILDELESFANSIHHNLDEKVSLEQGTQALEIALNIMNILSESK
jgi:predicted dehydrogenase